MIIALCDTLWLLQPNQDEKITKTFLTSKCMYCDQMNEKVYCEYDPKTTFDIKFILLWELYIMVLCFLTQWWAGYHLLTTFGLTC